MTDEQIEVKKTSQKTVGCFIMLLSYFLGGLFFLLGWNYMVSVISGLPCVTYWQGVCGYIFIKLFVPTFAKQTMAEWQESL